MHCSTVVQLFIKGVSDNFSLGSNICRSGMFKGIALNNKCYCFGNVGFSFPVIWHLWNFKCKDNSEHV